jgi:hypothetical protein
VVDINVDLSKCWTGFPRSRSNYKLRPDINYTASFAYVIHLSAPNPSKISLQLESDSI